MAGYSTREVAEILGITVHQVAGFLRSGLIDPPRDDAGRPRFGFPEVVMLRTLRELKSGGVPPTRLKKAIASLREQLPEGNALTSVHITSDGRRVVVRDEATEWEPDSGQIRLDFAVQEVAAEVAPFVERRAEAARNRDVSADEWFEIACDLESVSSARAIDAYRRALKIDPGHEESHLNLGRALHESGDPYTAESHYRLALASNPSSATAAFNLGVALEDLGRDDEALDAYAHALGEDPGFASAHFNLARLHERAGHTQEALRHLSEYKRLTDLEETSPGH